MPISVLSVWRDEFFGIHSVGGLTMLILHPQYTGRPSRLTMLQQLVDQMRDADLGALRVARRILWDSLRGRPDHAHSASAVHGPSLAAHHAAAARGSDAGCRSRCSPCGATNSLGFTPWAA